MIQTLVADNDCHQLGNTSEFYRVRCDTDHSIVGQVFCNRGCVDCISTNLFETSGISDSLGKLLGKRGGIDSLPVDSTCINLVTRYAWRTDADVAITGDSDLSESAPQEQGANGNGGTTGIDIQFQGICVAQEYEAWFEDPEHVHTFWLRMTPTRLILYGAAIIFVAWLIAYGLPLLLPESFRLPHWARDVFDVVVMFGTGVFTLGMFVWSSQYAIVTFLGGFVLVVLWKLIVHKTLVGKEWQDPPQLDSEDGWGAATTTKYMRMDDTLPDLAVLFVCQLALMTMIITELYNWYDDDGAAYDKQLEDMEPRNWFFFIISVLLQNEQYEELFGEEGSNWRVFWELVSCDNAGETRVLEVFRAGNGLENHVDEKSKWEEPERKKSRVDLFVRCVMMTFGEFICPMFMLVWSPVLLTFSETSLDFVLNALAFAFIGTIDNKQTEIRIRLRDLNAKTANAAYDAARTEAAEELIGNGWIQKGCSATLQDVSSMPNSNGTCKVLRPGYFRSATANRWIVELPNGVQLSVEPKNLAPTEHPTV